MADGVPDFADLLAAFEEAPTVNLQQISHGAHMQHGNNVQFGPNPSLHFNQQLVFNQNQENFVGSVGFSTQNQPSQISALQQDSQSNQSFSIQNVAQGNASVTNDSVGSGSLGLMFLSDVESQLSDEGNAITMSMPQPAYPAQAAQIRPTQQRPRQRQKQTSVQPRRSNLQSNRMSHNAGSPASNQVGNIGQAGRSSIHNIASISFPNAGAGTSPKMSASVASPPFVIPSEVQPQQGQQKVNVPTGQFVHPSLHGARQSGQSLPNPPRPLSAASSTSDHLSHPGSVPQPSPSCGSNHSGDPATPLTPQSYNAGTPQSYNPGTPQSISMHQQRQRNPGYSDVTQQQIANQSIILSDDSFTSHQRPSSVHTQPSPIVSVNTSNDTFSDFPTPLKEAFIPSGAVGSFAGSNTGSLESSVLSGSSGTIGNQSWMQNVNNQNSAVMAPNALFTNNVSSKEVSNLISTNSQRNYGYDPNSFTAVPSNNHYFHRTETNVGTASLTSKQNELLDQLSSFGKSKNKQASFAQQNSLDILEPNSRSVAPSQYSVTGKSHIVFGGNVNQEKTVTMNLMDKANDAGSAAVKELFQSPYEAISPVSDYAMSPANKSSLQDDLPESLLFSPSKFTSQKHNLPSSKQNEVLTDPVQLYLKHDDKPTATSNPAIYLQSQNDGFDTTISKNDWTRQFLTESSKDENTNPTVQSYVGIQHDFTSTSPNTLPSFLPSDNNLSGMASSSAWTSSSSVDNLNFIANSSQVFDNRKVLKSASASSLPNDRTRKGSVDIWKELQLSPQKERASKTTDINNQGSFGVSRRKSSTEKVKSVGRGKKPSSFDNDFGFDSDDDTEPTICLKKSDTKSKKALNLDSKPEPSTTKTSTHNALAAADLKDKMEHLKKLQQQQQMLMQLQEFQMRHGTKAKVAAAHSMHLTSISQPPVSKPYTESYQPRVSSKDISTSMPKLPTLPTLPVSKSTEQQNIKKSSTDFSAPMTLAPPSILSLPRSDNSLSLSTDSTMSNKPRALSLSVATTASVNAKFSQSSTVHHQPLPQFLSFLDTHAATSDSNPEQLVQAPAQITQFHTKTNDMSGNTKSSVVSSVGLHQRNQHRPLFFPHGTTSSTSNLPQHSAPSNKPSQNKPVCQSYPIYSHSASLLSGSNNNNKTSATATLELMKPAVSCTVSNTPHTTVTPGSMQPAVSESLSNRPQPFDSAHFDIEWLHREPRNFSNEKLKVSVGVTKPYVTPPKDLLHTSLDYATFSEKFNSPVFTTTNVKVPFKSKKEDKVLPLKQSLHHISVPKSQPALNTTSSFSTTNKDSVSAASTETKHLNLKKHRILEGYPHSTEVFKQSNKAVITSQANGIPATVAQSVLDKQRRYSKEHITKKTPHRVGLNASQVTKSPVKTTKNPALNLHTVTTSQTTVTESVITSSTTSSQNAKVNKKEQKVKGGQSGSMLSFFNSLLQEASESAADSLKVSNENTKENEQEINKNVNAMKSSSIELKAADVQVKTTVPQTTSVATPTSNTPVTTPSVQTVPPVKKQTKKHRPAATVPFKRRPYPAIDDLEASKSPVNASFPTAVLPKSVPCTLASSVPIIQSVLPKKSVSSPVVSVSTAPSSIAPPISASTVVSNKSESLAGADVPENTSLSGTGLPKLRITMFRSSKGQVIHQASMVGSNTEASNVDSDHSVHRKHKRKKKLKRKRKISSSSSVSSMTSMSSLEPVAKLVQQAAKLEEMAAKHLSNASLPVTTVKDLPIIPSNKIVPLVAESDVPKTAQKRKRTKGATAENSDKKKPVKRVKVTKPSAKRKTDTKNAEPIARYQPKSVIHATTHTTVTTKVSVTLPSTYHRAPGKLPLYLSTSEAQSATVPTIQLVARNTKLLETVVDKISQPTTVVNVKITNTVVGKTFPTQLLANTGVQYIIPGGKGQQRILLPNISTPISVPVSIVSPLLGRTFTSALLPMSSGTKTLLSVPLNINDAAKLTGSKPGKFQSKELSVARQTSVASAHSTTNYLTTHTTPSGTGTSSGPRVTTTVSSTILPSQNTANSFQSTFSKLISSQNPIPRYVPPVPPEDLEMDMNDRTQHQCLECKDTFMFNESLDCHYDRRCILIKVRCMQCNQNLVFLNKCKLLLHARQHSDKGGGMQFNNAHISPLPLSLCKPRTKEDFLHKSAAYERRKSSLTSSEDDNSFMNISTQSSCSSVMACTDCNFIAVSAEALEEHFQRHSPPPSPDANAGQKPNQCFSCDICSLPIPNQCSFNAHMRMHKRTAPHTCPECGQTFDNDGAKEPLCSDNKKEIDFNLHLSIQCFHLSRMSCYKCRLCSSIFKNAELLRRHLEVRHLQTFYKCRDCPMAFKTIENISSHQRSAHSVVAATKMIHKCPLCDTVFTDNSPTQQLFLLQKHFEAHISHPSINITAYKCLFCNNIYERKSLLREHLKTAHDVMSAGESDCELTKEINEAKNILERNKKDDDVGMKKISAKKRSIAKLTAKEPVAKIPKILSSDKVDAVTNLRIASGILGNMDGYGKKGLLSGKITGASAAMMKSARQPLKLRLKGMTTNSLSAGTSEENSLMLGSDESISNVPAIIKDGRKVYPCGECSKELPSTSARLNHIKLKHKGIRSLYCCPHCPVNKIRFAKKISLKKHLKKFHDVEEMKKHDMRIEYVKVPIGQRFDPSNFNFGKEDVQQQSVTTSPEDASGLVEHKVRKKITAVGRKSVSDKLAKRPIRQVRRDLENNSPYLENSDSEVEQITNRCAKEIVKSELESPNFSLLRFPDIYTCAKCQYQSKDRLEFQAHIVEHREEAEYVEMLSSMRQCTECGLCFASLGSHAKHMFIKHKIKKRKLLEQYDEKLRAERQANGSLPQPCAGPSGERNGSSAKMYRCSVCYRRFDDEGRLKTHMRTHGLAFVKSKHVS